jgi:repressor LexA
MPITARQGEYLAFIHRFTQKCGVAPSYEEIAAHFGTSSPAVNGMIKTLERRALLARIPGATRSLRVLAPASLLPDSDFGPRARRTARGDEGAEVPLVEAVVAAALAVLQVAIPKLSVGDQASGFVSQSARAVQASLERVGLGREEAREAARRVAAEAGRGQPDGQGSLARRRQRVRR